MTDVHLLCSLSAAGSLRQAFGRNPAIVTAEHFPDLGPLDDGRRRSRFLRDMLRAGSHEQDWERIEAFVPDDAFAPWTEARARIAETAPERLVVWVSGSGADHVHLGMAARFLGDTGVPLWTVPVPPVGDHHGVGIQYFERLRPMIETAVPLDAETCRRLAEEFDAIAARPEPLRMADPHGRLTFHDLSVYDDAILGHCTAEWKKGWWVVGDTLGHADGRNPPNQFIIMARLRHLAETGRVEIDCPVEQITRSFRVRLASGPPPAATPGSESTPTP